MRENSACVHGGASTSSARSGWRTCKRANKGCASTASPTQDGAMTSRFVIGAARLMSGFGAALERILRAAVRAQRLAGLLDRQKDARMRVPQQHGRRGAVQRQVRRGDFDMTLLVVSLVHGASRGDRC